MNVKESVEMAMIEKQTEAINTSAVDTVSGASESRNGLLEDINDALNQTQQFEKSRFSNFKVGTHTKRIGYIRCLILLIKSPRI